MTRPTAGPAPAGLWAALLATALVTGAGVAAYGQSSAHARHDPVHGLQQLDLLYLDEPAPALPGAGLQPGRPAVVVVCPGPCPLPDVPEAQVVRTTDPAVARRLALVTADGRVGPGYALVDRTGRLRYRTFDPGLAGHEPEIRTLVRGL